MSKYAAFDKRLFAWLADNREEVTTSQVNEALGADSVTLQRHVSRRFTQLEDRGILSCRLEGTTRICTVQKDLPDTLAKKRWRPGPGPDPVIPTPVPHRSIEATTSDEFIAAGGVIDKLPCAWDRKPTCNAVGLVSIDHVLAALD